MHLLYEGCSKARLKLGPKIRAEAHTCLSLVFQYSYSLGALDFDARPIPISNYQSFSDIVFYSADESRLYISYRICIHWPFMLWMSIYYIIVLHSTCVLPLIKEYRLISWYGLGLSVFTRTANIVPNTRLICLHTCLLSCLSLASVWNLKFFAR